jgi:hypothetical protein
MLEEYMKVDVLGTVIFGNYQNLGLLLCFGASL